MIIRYVLSSVVTLAFIANSLPTVAQSVVLGNGSAISAFSPLSRIDDYSVCEIIYLQSQINLAGPITTVGFQRHDGTNVDPFENVVLYLKHTNQTQLFNGNFDTTGYTRVYTGTFPNDAGAGWREVVLDSAFIYNNTENLQILVVKGYQAAIPNTSGVFPRWIYTNISPAPARVRRYYNETPISNLTPLTTTIFTSNARLTFNTTGIVEITPGIVSVYPNPSAGNITFNFENTADHSRLLLFNSFGALVNEVEISGKNNYKTGELTSGVYFFTIESKNKSVLTTGKVVISY